MPRGLRRDAVNVQQWTLTILTNVKQIGKKLVRTQYNSDQFISVPSLAVYVLFFTVGCNKQILSNKLKKSHKKYVPQFEILGLISCVIYHSSLNPRYC